MNTIRYLLTKTFVHCKPAIFTLAHRITGTQCYILQTFFILSKQDYIIWICYLGFFLKKMKHLKFNKVITWVSLTGRTVFLNAKAFNKRVLVEELLAQYLKENVYNFNINRIHNIPYIPNRMKNVHAKCTQIKLSSCELLVFGYLQELISWLSRVIFCK